MTRRGRRKGAKRAFRTGILVAGVAIFALLPLYGDSTPDDAVSHPEWARMVLRGLALLDGDTEGVNRTASLAFATLSGRDSRSWSADRYIRGHRIEVVEEDDTRLVRPTDGGQPSYEVVLRNFSPAPVRVALLAQLRQATALCQSGGLIDPQDFEAVALFGLLERVDSHDQAVP